MSITDVPTDEAITEMIGGLPSWDPPKFELNLDVPEDAEVQWHDAGTTTEEFVRPPLPAPEPRWDTPVVGEIGASFEIPGVS